MGDEYDDFMNSNGSEIPPSSTWNIQPQHNYPNTVNTNQMELSPSRMVNTKPVKNDDKSVKKDYNETTSKRNIPWGNIRFYCIFTIIMGAMIFLIYYGVGLLEEADIYETSATEEQCTVINLTQSRCTGKNESGDKYTYYVTSTKCGNQILESEFESCNLDPPKADIGETETCFILDCDRETFTWNTTSETRTNGIVSIVIGAILLFGSFVIVVGYSYCLCKDGC